MFAGAAREAVFSNRDVVRRVKADFIPVALKAGTVMNPPDTPEGRIYRHIHETSPAPQGICVLNSAGRVLDWALSFDDNDSLVEFLDYCIKRYGEVPGAEKPVVAERFMRFPSRKLPDVPGARETASVPEGHPEGERCFAEFLYPEGTLLGRVYGRAFKDGKPVPDKLRQEEYMEDRFEISVFTQEELARAAKESGGERFRLPNGLGRIFVGNAFLGMLDVNPIAGIRKIDVEFWGRTTETKDGRTRISLVGRSDVAGGMNQDGDVRSDGRVWSHDVALTWEGSIELEGSRITDLVLVARGREKLKWGNARMKLIGEPDVAHLMAGHPIDLDTDVRYGLVGRPVPKHKIGEPFRGKRLGGKFVAPAGSLQRKMRRFQQLMQKLRNGGDAPREVHELMPRLQEHMQKGNLKEAEGVLDRLLDALERKK